MRREWAAKLGPLFPTPFRLKNAAAAHQTDFLYLRWREGERERDRKRQRERERERERNGRQ